MDEKIEILKKYNFSAENLPDTGLTRHKYVDKIEKFTGNKLIKVLVGQRRTGKSYILRQIIASFIQNGVPAENCIYINRELSAFDFLTSGKELKELIDKYLELHHIEGKVYLFIDEVQNIKDWEKVINSYSQDYTRDIEIFITGSNSDMLSGELASMLSGRYVRFVIYPIDYYEYISFYSLQNNKASFLKYMKDGGLPELFHLQNEESKMQYVSAIKDTVLLRDIIYRYQIKNSELLENIFKYLANNASNLISINNILKYFKSKNRKTSYDTIAQYIEYMKNAFLVHQAERYHIKGKEILSGSSKYYINDHSYRNYLYSGFSHGYGYLLENIIYLELASYGYDVYIGHARNREIDFVAKKGERTLYIQCSYNLEDEKTIEREYSSLLGITDNYEKFIVSLDDLPLPDRSGVKNISAWKIRDIL